MDMRPSNLTAAAALSLAMGIGVETAIFGTVNAVMFGDCPLRFDWDTARFASGWRSSFRFDSRRIHS
jgi:hypothetical protein